MTTIQSNSGQTPAKSGRGVGALFDGATAPRGAQAIDADLAALLDDEIGAATAAPARERVDVPGADPAVDSVFGDPAVAPLVTDASHGRALPATQRFGAIIMDGAPATGGPTRAMIPGLRATPPGPGLDPDLPLPEPVKIERTEDQKAIVIARLDAVLAPDWQKALHQQIDDLYKQVATEFSSPPAKAERALTMLREARQVLVDAPDQYVTAEYRMMQVRTLIDRVQESRQQATSYGLRILAYETFWWLLLLAGILFATPISQWIATIARVTEPTLTSVYPVFNTMLWGGIGGVVGALYTLWWHISQEQDFDRNYLLWYMVQPMMGLVLGGIVFLIMSGGFLILQVNLADDKASVGARLLPYLVAVLAGFRQNFVYDQLDRLMSLFTPANRGS